MALDKATREAMARVAAEQGDLARRRRAAEEFETYYEYVGKNRAGGNEFTLNPITRIIAHSLVACFNDRKNFSLVAPPGLFKTTMIRLFMTWVLGRDPLARQIVVSAETTLSQRITAACRNQIMDSRFRAVFPLVKLDTLKNRTFAKGKDGEESATMGNQIAKFYLTNSGGDPDPAMEAVAAEPQGEMRRVDLGMFDDMSTRHNALSPTQRKSIRETFLQTWLDGRLKNPDRPGLAICSHNLWHDDDLPSHLAKNPRFCSVWIGVSSDMRGMFVRIKNPPPGFDPLVNPQKYGAEKTGASELRLPLLGTGDWTHEKLMAMKETNPFFSCQYQLIALEDKDRMFPSWANRKQIHGATIPGNQVDLYSGAKLTEDGKLFFPPHISANYGFSAGIDIAGMKRPMGNALCMMSIDANRRKTIPEIHFGCDTTAKRFEIIDSAWKRGFRFLTIRVEDNGVQSGMRAELQILAEREGCEWATLIEPHYTNANKLDPALGLPTIDLDVANGKLLWADNCTRPGQYLSEHFTTLEQQMHICPKLATEKSTPDGPMALWFADKGLRDRGFVLSAGAPRTEAVRANNSSASEFAFL